MPPSIVAQLQEFKRQNALAPSLDPNTLARELRFSLSHVLAVHRINRVIALLNAPD